MKRLRESLPSAVYSAAQVRELDRMAIERCGIAGYELMCRAGQAALGVLKMQWPDAHKVTVYCGAGNNAGDGYVLARLARAAGMSVRLEAVVPPLRLGGDARTAWEDCRDAGVAAEQFDPEGAPTGHFVPDVIVDALLGTGLDRPVEGAFARAVECLNASSAPILALDIPSGLDADTGRVLGVAVRAAVTVTFVGLKQGLFLGDAPDYRGALAFADLMLPPELPASFEPALELLAPALLRNALPPRPRSSHKGANGRVLLVGGGPGMPGAIRLAAEAALRVGAGLVHVGTHRDSVTAVMSGRPELMCRALDAPEDVDEMLSLADVVVLGPGLGKSDWARALWRRVLAAPQPLVLDADGLNLLAEQPIVRADWLLTPHPGEASRLLRREASEVQDDRLAAVQDLSRKFNAATVLKGACTLVAARDAFSAAAPGEPSAAAPGEPSAAVPGKSSVPARGEFSRRDAARGTGAALGAGTAPKRRGHVGERAARQGAAPVSVCDYGNPGMATAGMGDVLSGVLGGLLAQLGDTVLAARVGVLLHALAGDDAADDGGERGMLAGDLMAHLRRRANPT